MKLEEEEDEDQHVRESGTSDKPIRQSNKQLGSVKASQHDRASVSDMKSEHEDSKHPDKEEDVEVKDPQNLSSVKGSEPKDQQVKQVSNTLILDSF